MRTLTEHSRSGRSAPGAAAGFTLIELLVSISIIGLLLALILPAVMSARAAARTTQCKNNLRNLGIALHGWSRLNGRFPAAGNFGEQPPHTPYHNWVVDLLPWLDQSAMDREWDRDLAFNSPSNRTVSRWSLRVLVCPDDDTAIDGDGNLSYVVNGGFGWTMPVDCPAFMHPADPSGPAVFPFDLNGNGVTCVPPDETDGEPSDRELFKRTGLFFIENWRPGSGTVRHHTFDTLFDGVSQTLMLAENVRAGVDPFHADTNWANPYPWRNCFFLSAYVCENGTCAAGNVDYRRANDHGDPRYRLEAINASLTLPEGEAPWPSSHHTGGVNVVFADGRVTFLSEQADGRVYAALISPQGSLIEGPLAQQVVSGGEF